MYGVLMMWSIDVACWQEEDIVPEYFLSSSRKLWCKTIASSKIYCQVSANLLVGNNYWACVCSVLACVLLFSICYISSLNLVLKRNILRHLIFYVYRVNLYSSYIIKNKITWIWSFKCRIWVRERATLN